MLQISAATAGTVIAPEYATIRCRTSKWMLLIHPNGYFGLYTAGGLFVRLLPAEINASSEPRWSRTDPNLCYYIYGNQYKSCLLDADGDPLLVTVRAFKEYIEYDSVGRNGIQGLGEGDIEDHYFALAGMKQDGTRDVFLFDVLNLTKSPVLNLLPDLAVPLAFDKSGRAHGLDNIYACPSGGMTIGWYKSGTNRFNGVELYDRNMVFQRQLATIMGHCDVGTYQGHDVLIWCSSADPVINANNVMLIDTVTEQKRVLLRLDWAYAFHISCNKDDNACRVSMYDPKNLLPTKIVSVPFDGTLLTELVQNTGGTYRNYDSSPRATTDDQGAIVFAVDDGQTVNACWVAEPVEPAPVPQPSPLKPVTFPPNKHYEIHIDTDANGKPTVTELEN